MDKIVFSFTIRNHLHVTLSIWMIWLQITALDSRRKVFRNLKDKLMSSFQKEWKIKQNSFFFLEQYRSNNLPLIKDILTRLKDIMGSILNAILISLLLSEDSQITWFINNFKNVSTIKNLQRLRSKIWPIKLIKSTLLEQGVKGWSRKLLKASSIFICTRNNKKSVQKDSSFHWAWKVPQFTCLFTTL